MNQKNTLVLALSAALFSLSSIAQTNVYDDIIATSSNHTYLKAAIDQEGLASTLQNGSGTYTVFAPTNDAFDALALELNTNIAGLLALSNLSDILTYHVLATTIPASAVSNGAIVNPIFTGNSIKMTVTSNSEVFANHALVSGADLTADNGVVHSIDDVLLFDETVIDVAIDNGFSTLVIALIKAELVPTLIKPFAEFTVFAPSNAAFSELADNLNTDINGLLALTNLADILTYHVLSSEVGAASITNGQIVDALSATNTLKLSATAGGDVYVNQAMVTAADIDADNGVVHVLDAVVLPNETVVDVAIDNGFTTLTTAVVTADLLSTLSNPFAEFTVFAPSNAAFTELADNLNTDINGLLALTNLADILTYHVLSSEVGAASITNGQIVDALSATNTLKLSATAGGDVYVNQAMVTAADIDADNGVVHVLDAVVLPNETVVDVAIDNGFTTLTTAVVTADLLSTLSNPFAEFTVFAPTNNAFDSLAVRLGTDLAGILALPNLSDILLYHVVSGTVLSTSLTAGDVPTLNGLSVTVDLTAGVMINDATVTLADVTADNGVVHVIDGVLLPIPLSVNEMRAINVSAYPNPTADFVRVSNLIRANYQIMDLKGTMVKSGIMMDHNINISDLQSGTYIIMLDDESSSYQSTVVKL